MSGSPSEVPVSGTPAAGKPAKTKREKRRDPVEHDVYEFDGEIRRVVGLGKYTVDVNDQLTTKRRVCYSSGGNTNRWCNLKTFRKWMNKARLTHDGHKPSTGTQD